MVFSWLLAGSASACEKAFYAVWKMDPTDFPDHSWALYPSGFYRVGSCMKYTMLFIGQHQSP
jgi:hypothetical protein